MQDYLFSIIKTICDFCQTKKDFHDLWTLLANFVEMCLINEETPYVTKKVLWFYKKDVVDVKYSNDYINAQIKAFDEIKTVLRFFLKDHLNDMILLINTLNKRPE